MANQHTNGQSAGAYVSVDDLLQLRYLSRDLTLENRKKSSAAGDGDSRTHFRGRGMEFAEVRPYQPGDDIRNIDWRVTARTTETFTKLFQEERERPVFIVVDQRSPMFFGSVNVFKSVYAAQIAGVIAWVAMQSNDRIGALLFADDQQKDLRARRGKHAVLALLNQLQDFNHRLTSPQPRAATTQSHEIFTDIRRVAKPGSAVFVISDCHDFDASCEKPLAQLARHTDVTLFQVFDPLEAALPTASQLAVSNGEDRLGITPSSQFRQAFASQFHAHQELVQTSCRNSGTRFIRANVGTQVDILMRDIFVGRRSRSKPGGHA
ncbi:DUF58 domain-containing protein [Teredinibacter turnerae]|uniref:DUF58 domain-containing protein n=1 Tax=Teredinibacter turnerae TaxID=2426 RepID=UPI000373DE05|nr:DUF58 domain-containing protein [Teredinibacter turnerae]